jgi:ABC-type bacteriocin/lantibiotic exporter with double-glycine peptidase domain
MLKVNRDMLSIVQYLSVFAIASFRIIPGASRIFTSFQSIKFRQPSVELLSKEFGLKNYYHVKKNSQSKDLKPPLKFQKEINLRNVCFAYPIRKEFYLSEISMNIKKGNFIGIIGKTGSGKSTLINLFTGLLRPTEGKIEVDELSIFSNLSEWHKKIGYVPQSIYLTDDTIRKNIAFGLLENDIDNDLIKQAAEKANLSEFIKNLPNGLDTIVGEKGARISGGQQQRIGIARALYRNPEILILDEATSSLDNLTEKKIMDSILFLKGKKTLIVVTHRLSTVNKCDKIFFINKGKITKQGSPKEVLNNI